MRTLSRLAVLALVALALPASASAADPWSLPAPIRAQTTTPPLPGAPGLAADASGMAIAVADTGGASPDIGPHTLASVFAGGAFSDPGRLTPANVAMGPGNGRVLPYGETRIIGAGIRFARTSSQATFAFGRIAATGSSLDAPRGLGPSTMHAARATMAVNTEGTPRSSTRSAATPPARRCSSTSRCAGQAPRPSAPRSSRTAPGRCPQVAAAVNDRGDAMAVWTQGSTLYARIRTAGGILRPRRRVGTTVRGQHLAPSAVLSLHRAGFVGWLAQAVSRGEPVRPGVAWAAQARDGSPFTATRFGAIPAAGDGHYVSEAGVRVAYGSRGRALVAWTGYENGRFVVRQAQVKGAANNPSQSLVGVATLSQPGIDTVLSDLVVDPSGPTYVLMLAGARGSDSSSPTGLHGPRGWWEEVSAPVGPGAQPGGVVGRCCPTGAPSRHGGRSARATPGP